LSKAFIFKRTRNRKVFVIIVEYCSKSSLLLVKDKLLKTDSYIWQAYNRLILREHDHYQVYHSENRFICGKNRANDIEVFARDRDGLWKL